MTVRLRSATTSLTRMPAAVSVPPPKARVNHLEGLEIESRFSNETVRPKRRTLGTEEAHHRANAAVSRLTVDSHDERHRTVDPLFGLFLVRLQVASGIFTNHQI